MRNADTHTQPVSVCNAITIADTRVNPDSDANTTGQSDTHAYTDADFYPPEIAAGYAADERVTARTASAAPLASLPQAMP